MESQSLSSSPATLVPSNGIGDNPISHEFVTEDDSQAFGPTDREYSLDDSDLRMDVLERETRYGTLPVVHRLPAEILSAIFEWLATMYISQCHSTLRFDWWIAFPEMNLEQSHSRPSKFRSPADYWSNINLVCRRWRRVTLSTPALWT
ncbi:hypothetical protein BC629DRAFT_157785 [Irpex lacteus]|nr:hypothetical protein BC629DRAFT_157785 [Irpex lacteus]